MVLGIRGIEESWVYQDIFSKGEAKGEAKGRAEEDRAIILRLGRNKFGQPDETVLIKLAAISDLDRLHSLLDRILDASTWEELLASLDP